MAEDTISSGLEGAWSAGPTAWTSQFLDNLLGFDWVKTKSPAGATQWIPPSQRRGVYSGRARIQRRVTRRSCSQRISRSS